MNRRQAQAASAFEAPSVTVKVVGLGGCGGNLVSALAGRSDRVDLIVANTDRQALEGRDVVGRRILIGPQTTHGWGAGSDPQVGRAAAQESRQELERALAGADLVVIAAGMGGGTGTGSAPLVARQARELGAITLAIVTMPFDIERGQRTQNAERGLNELREICDAVVVVPNEQILRFADREMTMTTAMRLADKIVEAASAGVIDALTLPGMMRLDFSYIRRVLTQSGQSLLGIGSAAGPDAAMQAARQAVSCDLLDGQIDRSRRVFISLVGGSDMGLLDVNAAVELITRDLDADVDIVVGAATDPRLPADRVRVTMIAGAVPSQRNRQSAQQRGVSAVVQPAYEVASRPAPAETVWPQPRREPYRAPQPAEVPLVAAEDIAAIDDTELDAPPFLTLRRRGRR